MAKSKEKSTASDSPEMEKYPSMLHLDAEELPEIEDWEVGKKYELQVEVTMTGKSQPVMGDDDTIRGEFKINDVEAIGEKSKSERLKEKYA